MAWKSKLKYLKFYLTRNEGKMEAFSEYFSLPLSIYEFKRRVYNPAFATNKGETNETKTLNENQIKVQSPTTSRIDSREKTIENFSKEVRKRTRAPPKESFTDIISHLKHLTAAFWIHSDTQTRSDAWGRLILVLMLQVCRAKISTFLSWTSTLQVAKLGNKSEFRKAVLVNLLAILCLSPVENLHARALYALRIKWTQYLTTILLQRYVQTQCKEKYNVENMDQHISADVEKVSHELLSIVNCLP